MDPRLNKQTTKLQEYLQTLKPETAQLFVKQELSKQQEQQQHKQLKVHSTFQEGKFSWYACHQLPRCVPPCLYRRSKSNERAGSKQTTILHKFQNKTKKNYTINFENNIGGI